MAGGPMAEEEGGGPAGPDRYRAPALDKGLDILEILAAQPQAMTRAEIVREMGLNPSQIYRMLERLVARGYVARLDGGDRYALSMRLFLLAHHHPPLRRMIAEAQPLMDRFALETRQSCHLVVPERGAGVVIAQASPAYHWEFRIRLGARLDLFNTGSGQTLLAFQRDDRLAETLACWGIAGAAERLAGMAAHLAQVRAAGYRQAPSAHLVGVEDISLPVLGIDGQAIAALTCPYIAHPDDPAPDGRGPVLARLAALAAELSHSGVSR